MESLVSRSQTIKFRKSFLFVLIDDLLSSLRNADWRLRLGDGIQWEGGGPSDHDAGAGEGQAVEGGPSSRRNRVFLFLSSRFCILLVKYIHTTYFGGLKSILLSFPYLDVIAQKNVWIHWYEKPPRIKFNWQEGYELLQAFIP